MQSTNAAKPQNESSTMKRKTITISEAKANAAKRGGGRSPHPLAKQTADAMLEALQADPLNAEQFEYENADFAAGSGTTGESLTEKTRNLSENLKQQIEKRIGYKISRTVDKKDTNGNEDNVRTCSMRFTDGFSSRTLDDAKAERDQFIRNENEKIADKIEAEYEKKIEKAKKAKDAEELEKVQAERLEALADAPMVSHVDVIAHMIEWADWT